MNIKKNAMIQSDSTIGFLIQTQKKKEEWPWKTWIEYSKWMWASGKHTDVLAKFIAASQVYLRLAMLSKIPSVFMLRRWILLCQGEHTFENSGNFFLCSHHSKSIVDKCGRCIRLSIYPFFAASNWLLQPWFSKPGHKLWDLKHKTQQAMNMTKFGTTS